MPRPGPARPHRLHVRLSDEEHAALKARVPEGMYESEWVRSLVLGQPIQPGRRRPPPPPVDPALLREVGRIGQNLNQVTRLLNAGFRQAGGRLRPSALQIAIGALKGCRAALAALLAQAEEEARHS